MNERSYPFADLALSRRLELAEAHSCAMFVEARARAEPERGAQWIGVAGAKAMFDGISSPVTQTFGLGIVQAPTKGDFAALELFFRERGAHVDHEVSPLADPATQLLLAERGYQPIEFTSVMFRPIAASEGPAKPGHDVQDTQQEISRRDTLRVDTSHDGTLRVDISRDGTPRVDTSRDDTPGYVVSGFSRTPASGFRTSAVSVRLIDASEGERWAQVSAAGWMESGAADFVLGIGRVHANAPDTRLFMAEIDGSPIAAAALNLSDGVAHLAGASTVPSGRKQGAQLALLDARLRYAAGHGCDLALMGAAPGSGSQRNAERHGFRIAYTRVKWRLKPEP